MKRLTTHHLVAYRRSMGALLVGVDGSPESAAALRWACWFAAATGDEVHLAHAWQHGRRLEPLAAADGEAGQRDEVLETRIRARLQQLAEEQARPPSIVTDCVALRGEVAASLGKQAQAIGGAVIVVGASGAGRGRRAQLGSVSRELTGGPAHTVVVVPEHVAVPDGDEWSIVVGVDGSASSARAVRWSASAAARGGGRVVAVHVVEPPQPDLTGAEREAVIAEVHDRLEHEWCAPLRAVHVAYSTVIETGDAEAAISRVADATRPACVALGSRGLGPVTQRLLGSVTHQLIRRLDWPAVVVPGPRDRVVWSP